MAATLALCYKSPKLADTKVQIRVSNPSNAAPPAAFAHNPSAGGPSQPACSNSPTLSIISSLSPTTLLPNLPHHGSHSPGTLEHPTTPNPALSPSTPSQLPDPSPLPRTQCEVDQSMVAVSALVDGFSTRLQRLEERLGSAVTHAPATQCPPGALDASLLPLPPLTSNQLSPNAPSPSSTPLPKSPSATSPLPPSTPLPSNQLSPKPSSLSSTPPPKSPSATSPLPPSPSTQLSPKPPSLSSTPPLKSSSATSPLPPSTPLPSTPLSMPGISSSHPSPPLNAIISSEPITSPEPCSSPHCPSSCTAPFNPPAAYNVVDEFPAHKIAFFVASEYFQAFMEWEDPTVIYLDVQQEQVEAAQALVYFLYHGAIQQDLRTADVAQLLILMDQYQVASGMKACEMRLITAMDGGKNVEAVLHVCKLLSHLGSPSPTTHHLYSFFSQQQENVREALLQYASEGEKDHSTSQGFSASASKGSSRGNPGCRSGLHVLVTVLQGMFQDMDRVWSQEEFRVILHLFPVQAVKHLLAWDDLCPTTENVIVSAIHHYLLAQPIAARAEAAEELLSVVRVPFLSPSYLSQVLPSFPWVRESEQGDHLVRIGTQAALAGRDAHQWFFSCLPRELAHLSLPRQYQAAFYREETNIIGEGETGDDYFERGDDQRLCRNKCLTPNAPNKSCCARHVRYQQIHGWDRHDGASCVPQWPGAVGDDADLDGPGADICSDRCRRLRGSESLTETLMDGSCSAASRQFLSQSFPQPAVRNVTNAMSKSCQWPMRGGLEGGSCGARGMPAARQLDWSEEDKCILEWTVSWQAIVDAQKAAQAAGTRVSASQGTHTVAGPSMWVNGVCVGVELSFYLPLSSATTSPATLSPPSASTSRLMGASYATACGMIRDTQMVSSSLSLDTPSGSDTGDRQGVDSDGGRVQGARPGALGELGAGSGVGSTGRGSTNDSWIERALDLMAGREPASEVETTNNRCAVSASAASSSSSSSSSTPLHQSRLSGVADDAREGVRLKEEVGKLSNGTAGTNMQQAGGVVSFKWFWNMGHGGSSGGLSKWDDGEEVVLGWQLSSPRVLVSYEMELNGAGATVGRVLPANNIRRGKTCVARNEKSFACILAFQCPENMEELAVRGESLQLVLRANVW